MMSPLQARRIALMLVLAFSFQNAVAALIAGGNPPIDGHSQHDSGALVSPSGHHGHALQVEHSNPSSLIVTSSFHCDGDPLCSCCAGGCIPALADIGSGSGLLAGGAVFLPLSAPQPAQITVTPFRPPIFL